MRKKSRLETRTMELTVPPERGAAMLAASVVPPEGFVFHEMKRTGSRVVITFVRPESADVTGSSAK